jgi:polysaccharide pyruvyl transferase WcaK-like protein
LFFVIEVSGSESKKDRPLVKTDGSRKRIAILGPFSFGNLGNAALQETLAQQIDLYFPGSEVYGCYIDPENREFAPAVRPFPLNRRIPWKIGEHAQAMDKGRETAGHAPVWVEWVKRIPLVVPFVLATRRLSQKCKPVKDEFVFWLRAYIFARGFRIMIAGMGGLIDDVWGGPWAEPYALFKWAVVAKAARTPFVFMSVGAERIETSTGKFFLKNALSLAEYRSYRDVESREKVEKMGVRGPNLVYPDLAFSLQMEESPGPASTNPSRKLAGISPMAYCDPRVWPTKNPTLYSNYLKTLGLLIEWLLKRDYRVLLFATQIRMDEASISELKEIVLARVPAAAGQRLCESKLRGVQDAISLAAQVDFVVTSRLHGAILPFLAGTPVLAMSHSSKVNRLMEEMGLQEYCFDIDTVELAVLQEKILDIEGNQDILRQRIRSKVALYRVLLKEQFQTVFGPIECP